MFSSDLVDGIYLHPTADKQAGHEILNLATESVVTCARVWEIPTTPLVIKAVEDMAEKQGIKTLKIKGKNKQPILPVNWIAGVEYDFDKLDDNDAGDADNENYDPNEEDDGDDDNDDDAVPELAAGDDNHDAPDGGNANGGDESDGESEDEDDPVDTDDESLPGLTR